jgi:3-oxoacyl-[acyl-carrier protein] reductase
MYLISTPSHVARDLLGTELGTALRRGFGGAADLDGRASRFDRDPALAELAQSISSIRYVYGSTGNVSFCPVRPAAVLVTMRNNMDRLAGQVALVTGGSRGIGAEIVRRLAADGADVGFTYHTNKDEAQQVAAQVRGLGHRARTVQADLGEPAAAAAVVDAVTGEFGQLDILVNNAGITHWGSLAQTSRADFDRLVAVDARGPFLMMAAAADQLADGGRIVNISSGVTSTAVAGIALYSGAKAFVDQVTRVAAIEFAARGITVNAVAPGSTATGPFAHLSDQQLADAGAAFALGRIGAPADTAGVVAFLVSEDAAFVTGQVIYAAGGQRGAIFRAS